MVIEATILLFSASVGVAIAAWLLLREKRILPTLAFSLGLVLFAADLVVAFLSLQAKSGAETLTLARIRLMILSCAPGVWVAFAVTYSRGNHQASLRNWVKVIGGLLIILPGLALLFPAQLVMFHAGELRLGQVGRIMHMAQILGATAVLMNIERTFRAAVGVMRWQLKFVVIGVATLFLTRVYTSTQVLVYSSPDARFDSFNAVALAVCSILTYISITRSKSFMLDLYPSSILLYRSFTVILVGAYLLTVGFLAQIVTRLGGVMAFPVHALILLVALVLLSLVAFSDRLRLQAKQFVSRHLHRPIYDVRKIWREFSRLVSGQVNEEELCGASVKWLSQTFESLSVTIWLVPPNQAALVFGASTSLTAHDAGELLQQQGLAVAETLSKLQRHPEPMNIDAAKEEWIRTMRGWHPATFVKGGHRIAVPVLASGEVVALLMLGDRVAGVPFSVEELDLIKCVADQIGGDLIRLRLSQKLLEAKEIQAFQTMATFFVHDLKNTAWTLSLLVQNLQVHFDRPEFRDEAVRALSNSVGRINDLVSRIGSLREEFRLNRQPADFNELIAVVLKEFAGVSDVTISQELKPVPEIMLDREQLQKVVRNLVLNAKEAARAGGEIHVATEQREGCAVLTVRDNGSGMSEEFLRHQLFRPFQTTKKKGIGIGMFQSKMIVEAHQGRIFVDSKQGQGTTFSVLVPMPGEAK